MMLSSLYYIASETLLQLRSSTNPIYVQYCIFIYLKHVFICFWLCWVFVAVHRLSLVVLSRGSSLVCMGFSFWWLLLLQSTGSRMQGFAGRELTGCGAQAQLPRGTWNLPRPGIKPVSPALADRFLTTGPPGKSQYHMFNNKQPSV